MYADVPRNYHHILGTVYFTTKKEKPFTAENIPLSIITTGKLPCFSFTVSAKFVTADKFTTEKIPTYGTSAPFCTAL